MLLNLNESKINDLNEKYRDIINQNPIWENTALIRNKGHVYGVQTFAKKIGHNFPEHDADKFDSLYVPYVLISMGYNPDFKDDIELRKKENPEMDSFMRWASFSHVTNNSHHPEAWDIESATIMEKSKENEQMIDATKMPEIDIIEMCCDWASVGAEKGNSPQSWFKLKNGKKWKFTQDQEKLIEKTLDDLWPGGSDETSEIKHNERYFNDELWSILNKTWESYNETKTLREDYDFGEFENAVRSLAKEKENVSNIVGKLTSRGYEPEVSLQGVGSLQSLSFLFSPTVTNYVMNLLDSLMNKNYSSLVDDKILKNLNLDKVEFGDGYSTRSKITSNFANGILKSLNNVNESKLKNKLLLINKFIGNLKRHSKTIEDKIQRQEYMQDVKSFMKVIGIIKNIVSNRNSFINVLNKTLLLQESGEEVVSDMFHNIYEGI